MKATALLGLNRLLNQREDPAGIPQVGRSEVFTSGPARWVLGRQKVGGVVMFWGEDWDVPGTEGGGGPGADDLHLILAISEGSLDAIEAVWLAGERFDVKFLDSSKTQYGRRGARSGDSSETLEGLPLDLDYGSRAFFDESADRWRESPDSGSRFLDEENEEDAELIRRAELAQAISLFPYFDSEATARWGSVRTYTDRADPSVLGRATPFTDWSAEHRLKGISGIHVRLRQWTKHEFDQRVFTAGVPNISFLVRGIRVTFPEPEASSGFRTEWTDNAAAIRYWWHRERRGIPAESIDRDSFVAAWRVCEKRIVPSLPESWPGGEAPEWAQDESVLSFRKYSANGVVTSGESPAAIEASLDDAWQGFVVEEGGKLRYFPGSDRVDQPIPISGEDVLSLPSWQPAPSLNERVNAVTLTLAQSSFHDFNRHSLREIPDLSKEAEVDQGLRLPQDLGIWRWCINPAQGYSLGVMTLRRARHSGTLTLRLPPGTEEEPICYLAMSPGLIYTLNMPEEGFDARRMMLVDKQISEEMIVEATFVESPLGIYASDYQLPDVPEPPEYIPPRQGARPPKPTGLAVTYSSKVSNDGSVYFRISASVNESPLRTIFRLTAGEDQWEIETSASSYTFSVNVPRQSMGITARHIDKAGVRSLPARHNFTPSYEEISLPRPLWQDAIIYGSSLRLIFERVDYGAPISGVEIRYSRKPLGNTEALPPVTEEGWNAARLLSSEPVQMVRGLDVYVNAVAPESGRYALYARLPLSRLRRRAGEGSDLRRSRSRDRNPGAAGDLYRRGSAFRRSLQSFDEMDRAGGLGCGGGSALPLAYSGFRAPFRSLEWLRAGIRRSRLLRFPLPSASSVNALDSEPRSTQAEGIRSACCKEEPRLGTARRPSTWGSPSG